MSKRKVIPGLSLGVTYENDPGYGYWCAILLDSIPLGYHYGESRNEALTDAKEGLDRLKAYIAKVTQPTPEVAE